MNSQLAIIIPPDIESPDLWVADQMRPFSIELKVKQYKDYLSENEIAYLMEYHDCLTHFELLMKKNAYKEIFFEDKNGIFQYSEYNSNWKWQKWSVGGQKWPLLKTPVTFAKNHWHDHTNFFKDLDEFKFFALLTPEGDWRDCHECGWSKFNEDFKPVKNEDAWSQWLSQMEALKSQYEEHVVLSVVYEY